MEDDEESIGDDSERGRSNQPIRTKKQMEEFLIDLIEGQTVYELILLHADKVCRVKSFLTTVALHRRFLKKRRAVKFIKGYYRLYRHRKQKRLEAEK